MVEVKPPIHILGQPTAPHSASHNRLFPAFRYHVPDVTAQDADLSHEQDSEAH